MAEIKEIMQAKEAYDKLCEMLDDHKWNYERDDDKFEINCGAQGDDLPMDIRIVVDPEKMLVSLFSPMPFKVAPDRVVEVAVAVSVANFGMVDGCFDFNCLNGRIIFRMTTSIRESVIGKEVFEYLLFLSCSVIDEYNDKFQRVAEENMKIDDIIDYIKGE